MAHFFLDSSALAKRYVSEKGTDVVNWLFSNVPSQHLHATDFNLRDRLLLLTSDERLQRAAKLEALHCLNPETDDITALQQFMNQAP